MSDTFSIFTESYLRNALLTGLMTAGLCAYLGVYILMKRIVFMSIALSSLSSLGIALGMIIGLHPTIGAALLTLFGIIVFWAPFQERNVSRESVLGFTYAMATAASILLVAKNPMAEARGLNLFSGNLIYSNTADLLLLLPVLIVCGIVHLVFFKEFIFISFDGETARTTGLNVRRLDFLLYLTIGITISASMKTSGMIFVFASLVIPAMTGLVLSNRIGRIFVVSCLTAGVSVLIGFAVSHIWDLPYSHSIVVVYGIVFLVANGMKLLSSGAV